MFPFLLNKCSNENLDHVSKLERVNDEPQFLCISLLPFMKSQQSITYYRNMLAFVLFLHKLAKEYFFGRH